MSISQLQDIFVERLKAKMKEKALSLRNLAKNTGISFTTIDSWLLKKQLPSMYPLYLLANYFNVSVDYFFGLTDFD